MLAGMDQPIVIPLAWLVFAAAVSLKLWRLGRRLIEQQRQGRQRRLERFRGDLERRWRQQARS